MLIKMDELIFFLTYRCNFKCKTCFYVDDMNKNIMNKSKELSIDEISKISSSVGRFSRLLLSGGEPVLRDDLPDICEIFHRQNKISFIHLPSNGFYPDRIYSHTRKIFDRCPNIELIISLSLDGLEETHDKIKGVQGSFKKVIEATKGLAALKKRFNNLKIFMITVVNNLNFSELISLSEFVKNNLPVDGHGPSPMRGMPYDKGLSPPSYKQWSNLSEYLTGLYRYWHKKRMNRFKAFLVTNKMRYLYKIYAQVLKDKKMPFRCQAGNIISVLEPNGDVKLCELTDVIGNVRNNNYDFRKVLFSEKGDDIRKKIRHCACTHACFLEPSIRMNPSSLLRSYFWGG